MAFGQLPARCRMSKAGHPDLIELQLAHAERNEVRAAYNKAQRLAERRTMMQAWADYLDRLKASETALVKLPIQGQTLP